MKQGGIVAQLARARGSYPRGHWFEPNPVYAILRACGAAVAQRTHNPLVAGSNPAGPIFLKFTKSPLQRGLLYFKKQLLTLKFVLDLKIIF